MKLTSALVLADDIDPFTRKSAPDVVTQASAANELRRLYAVVQELESQLSVPSELSQLIPED